MTFELLPGAGLVLPANAGTLRFGMTEHQAKWTASTLANVRTGWWMCGARWSFSIGYRGVQVIAYSCAHRDAQTMDHLVVERFERRPDGPSEVAVALGDVDMFGYPINELVQVVDLADRTRLWPGGVNPLSTQYLPRVFLDACDAASPDRVQPRVRA